MVEEKRKISSFEIEKIDSAITDYSQADKPRIRFLFFGVLLCILFGWHIYIFNHSSWSLISKWGIVLVPISIWVYVEDFFKIKKKKKTYLEQLTEFKEKNELSMLVIRPKRVLEFLKFEEDMAFYLVEEANGQSFYLCDFEDQFPIEFPTTILEYYLDDIYSSSTNQKLLCKGSKIPLIGINTPKNWADNEKMGDLYNFESPKYSFDEFLSLAKKTDT